MSLIKDKNRKRNRRASRVRLALKSGSLPRVSVFRSLNNISVQLIDDAKHSTIASCSTLELKPKGDKKAQAHAVGLEFAKRAKEKGIDAAKFDRGPYLYHGRLKAFAEGLREGGLNI
jgi:large subunit ribosomal protein L18